jgi:hypothetical protein
MARFNGYLLPVWVSLPCCWGWCAYTVEVLELIDWCQERFLEKDILQHSEHEERGSVGHTLHWVVG